MSALDQARTAEDVFDDAFFDDPYPAYADMRSVDPVLRMPFNLQLEQAQQTFGDNGPTWMVTGFEACNEALRRHPAFSSAIPTVSPEEQERQRLVLINTDQPRHTRLRGMLNKALTPRRVAALEPWIQTLVRQLLDDAGTGRVDLVETVAEPLPILVIASLIGVKHDDLRQFKTWSDAMVALPTPETMDENRAKTQAMHDYIGALMADRRENPADDFMSTLLQSRDESAVGLEDWEIASFCVLLLLAGNETTRNLGGVHAQRPGRPAGPVGGAAGGPLAGRPDRRGVAALRQPGADPEPVDHRGDRAGRPRAARGRERRGGLRGGQPRPGRLRQPDVFDPRPSRRTATSASASASTSAWARRWPGWRARSSSTRCWTASRRSTGRGAGASSTPPG